MSKKIWLVLGIVILLGIFFLSQRFNSTPGPVTELAQPSGRAVEFLAPDGYRISATYYPPQKEGKHPVVILVHQFNSTRADFADFIPDLLKQDFAVLAYDIRGMGQSRGGATQINDFPKDVRGAVDYLKSTSGVESDKVAVLGASVGANVAFVASGSIPEVKAAVSLSPSNTTSRGGVLLGQDIPNFSPHNILIASDENEKTDADFIFSLSREIKRQRVYPGAGHGRSILGNKQAREDIIRFLNDLLK